MINYLIVDDEPIAHRIIEGYAVQLPHLNKIGNCYNAFEAMQLLNKGQIELIFLDINMPKLTGFEFLKTLDYKPLIVVTTAYKEFALEGYELNVLDYLLKPFSFERFVKAINKVAALGNHPNTRQQQTTNKSNPQRIFLKGDKKHYQIELDKILYLEAYGNYTKVQLTNQVITTNATLTSYEKTLPASQFMRIHKSFIVAIPNISIIEGNRIKIGLKELPIGQTYKRIVQQLLSNRF
ncbi:LytR/AlgR family response regulator transcription factor [Aureispira anguillae]|uniref:LytTR family DNA-binding domain-containing protein n=1 Tax=Aureispira anguillae TaxID=2864201 RepID=A0A915YLM5_9BACT|nr:LytTR family DNA-binding domain-containing protein [Aureispira anguillae]BDS15211.1 LytTR family DNA-binding domain-containing protein [Aureispira anguillae]